MGRIPLDPDEDALLRSYSLDIEAVSWSRQDELFRHWSPQGDITQLPLLTLSGLNSTKVLLLHGPPGLEKAKKASP